jgi:hypothetical protein
MFGAAPRLSDQTEQAAQKGVTLTCLRSRSGGEPWKRKVNDGCKSRQGRSEIHIPEAHGVNSAVWVWERAGHEGQGSSPRPERPSNLSWVSAPNVRYCKTMSHVERKDLLEIQTTRLPPSPRSGSSDLAELGSGLYRRGQAMGEGESLWSPIICHHQMNRSTCWLVE